MISIREYLHNTVFCTLPGFQPISHCPKSLQPGTYKKLLCPSDGNNDFLEKLLWLLSMLSLVQHIFYTGYPNEWL